MKTWLLCESCVHAEYSSQSPREDLITKCADCAKACFAVVSRLVSQAGDIGDLVLNCLLHCRECADECEKYNGENDIELCGDVCRVCGDKMKDIAVFALN